jgi:hypothetical protein
MNYYLKPGAIFLSYRTILFALTLLTCFLIATSKPHPHYAWLISNFFMSIFLIYPEARLFIYWVSGKPRFIVNDSYIHDCLNERLYYWEDIEDAVAEYDYLKINLYQTQKHPIRLYSFWSRPFCYGFSKKSKGKISFYIYIGALNVNNEEFLETLNNYSIAAEDKG